MNKKELIRAYAEKMSLTLKESERMVSSLFELIEDTVASGTDIRIVGHGNYELKDVPAKDGISKLGGVEKPWHTDACKKPSFSPGSSFKNKCN